MDLNTRIEYLQRLGNKTELKDILNNNILIRIWTQEEAEIFVKALEIYKKNNDVYFNSHSILEYNSYPTQIRFVRELSSLNPNRFNLLIYGAISDSMLIRMMEDNKAINCNMIHFEEKF